MKDRQWLIENMVCETEYTEQELQDMTNRELLDAYLSWNGIIGYTDDICDVFESLTGVEL